eukprot:CAMPEP_0174274970 /NCGR_PEP_ID=MMETSP0439-20130205/59574_1 /TAXON_ID=0 /ORGANISM="Stereomyxa ramosa, Strain Chinc5" /LENGTH=958 /DNA_ID=CAMNT_0015367039 /DNA_START=37 /DNA_END=2910 /DNA_ORIENTATION=+
MGDREIDAEIARQFQEVSARVGDYKWKVKHGKKADKSKVKNVKQLEMHQHICPLEEILEELGTCVESGLTEEAVLAGRAKHGWNELTPPKPKRWYVVLAGHMFGGFSLLLWAGAILSLIGYVLTPADQNNLYLAVVLTLVVVITGFFSYFQEAKAAKVMEGFKKMTAQDALALREGELVPTPARDLVPGDIVKIKYGDKVPADIRIIECDNLKVDNSSLTGEAEPQARSPECTDENPLETKNIAFFSTNVMSGSGTGLVIHTGDATVIGTIANLASTTNNQETPIAREISHFIHIIASIAIILGVVFFIFGLFTYDPITDLVFAIGIIVANVPEGLLATVTVSLRLTAVRMSKKNVLVKNLESVETLGSTSVICSDKTGTLTQNRMTISHLWYDANVVSTDTALTKGTYDPDSETFQALLRIATLCNTSVFAGNRSKWESVPVLQRAATSDASEQAMIKFAHPIRDIYEARERSPLVAQIPFNSSNKFHVIVRETEDPDDDRYIVLMKGAPERIIERCSHILIQGEELELTQEWIEAFQTTYNELGGMGERVLGFCHLYLDEDMFPPGYKFKTDEELNFPIGEEEPEMVFVGLMSLIDPPRPAVPSAVKTCQRAGIKVIMVTGDHAITAQAIARQVNIIKPGSRTLSEIATERGVPVDTLDHGLASAIVVSGSQLKDLSDYELEQVLHHDEIVFARTNPQQKLRIVEGCQKLRNVVAVTGDGVNDSPALKKADIGVAMGISGSDVSQEAADMILRDDNFASIVKGVKEGRLIFDNLKKSIAYTLSSNIPELLPFILFILIQIPLPLTTVLILCIDLGTDMIPAISLAYENAESDIMERKPRNADTDKLVTAKLMYFSYLQIGVIQALAGMYTYFIVMNDYGFAPNELINKAADYEDSDIDDFETDDGIYDSSYREDVLAHAQTAYFVSIVIVQWADLLICKTRKLSIFQQGMTNKVLW